MKTLVSLGKRFLPCAALVFLFPAAGLFAAQLKEARVSQVIKDVKLLPGQAAPRPANVSDEVHNGTGVRTGVDSRAELTFTDQTLARLGANTIFSFNGGTRNLELGGGAMLLRVPKNSGGAQINTAAVTAAITGTTVMLEYHPDAYIKFIILEGTGRVFRKDHVGESVLLHAGQMLIVNPNAKSLPDPVDVDLDRLIKTSLLIVGFRPLPSTDLIAREIKTQATEKSGGGLIDTNLVIFGRGTAVSLLDPTNASILDQANANETRHSEEPTATPTITPTAPPTVTPTPSKFGALQVIPSPNPYVIGNGTLIKTDPSITTGAQTDFGKIYRGPAQDGQLSQYLFGSTSGFDTNSGFNSHFATAANEPMAVFKFNSLRLTGNPTVSLAQGGTNKLGLISVGDITSGTAPATLTFNGVESLLLATQNGSITLGSNITFQNIPTLFLYARGTGSRLTFDSSVSGTTNLVLFSEGDILATDSLIVNQTAPAGFTGGLFSTVIAERAINVGSDLTISIDSTGTDNDSGINVATDTGSLDVGGAFDLTIKSTAGRVANGGSINVNAGTDLSAGSMNFTANFASAQSSILNGANIVINTGGNLGSSGAMNFSVLNNGGGNIGNGGNIFVTSGGDLTADTITALVNNRDAGTIGSGGNVIFTVGGTLNTTGDASFIVSGRNDSGAGGGTINTGGVISLSAGSIVVGGQFTAGQGLSGGTRDEALETISVTGDLSTGAGLLADILNGGNNISNTPVGATAIANDVLLNFTAARVTTGDFLAFSVNNFNGGTIGGSASLNFDVTGAVAVQTDATFELVNDVTSASFTAPSTIGANAEVSVAAGSLSAASLIAQLVNQDGAKIGGSAGLDFSVNGALSTSGDTVFRIVNSDDGAGLGGGHINGDASINVNAGSLLSGGQLVGRILDQSGTILGDRSVTFSVANALTAGGDATFEIFDFPPSGTQTGNFSISVTAGSIDVTGALTADVNISSDNPVYLTNNVTVSADQNITVGGLINIFGSLAAGGNITAGDTITVGGGTLTAGGNITSTTGDINLQISPTNFGALIAGGSINAHDIRALTIQAGTNITVGSTAGGPFLLEANSTVAGGALNLLNVSRVIGATSTFGPNGGFTPDPFTLSASSLTVTGPSIPALSFNGTDGSATDPGNGGSVTLNLSADSLIIGTTGDFTSINANGGAFAAGGSVARGNGGTVDITTSGDVTVNDAGITADSGANSTGTAHGNGGTVNITSGGTVNINTAVQTSGNGSGGSDSVKGGNINLTSSRATGVAINVSNTGQLLALLSQAAPGPGGKITILATGAGSNVAVNGGVQADKGTVDIRHTGANGVVNLGDASGNSSATLNGDLVKAGALGANGVLNVGGGSLSANSVLKLYAPSSNGTLNFIANVNLSSGTNAILAANTITIQPAVTVTVQGNGGPAQVFTNNPNYSGSGGNNPNNGTFGGNGANNPLPLNQAPPFDGPPGG